MLRELSDMQESDETVWEFAEVSFTIETRADEDGEIVERKYTFSNAPEWEKWMLAEYEELRTENTSRVSNRNWRRSDHRMWHEPDAEDISVPPEVTDKLQNLLDLDELVLQVP
jgi:hypothetical protein